MSLLLNRNLQVLYLVILSTAFFCIETKSQQKRPQQFLGKIVNSTNKEPVSYGMIINKTSKQTSFSDSLGFFSVQVTPGDTLIISRIGYFQKEILITEALLILQKFHILELNERSYELSAVSIEGLGTYESFKYKVINSELPKDPSPVNPEISKAFEQKVVILEPQMRIPLGSPVTAVYMLLSKEGKTLRKLEKEEAKDREIESYKDKYSPEIVSQLTGLKELELEKFMKYCNISSDFIKKSAELDIAEKILNCFKTYKVEKEKEQGLLP